MSFCGRKLLVVLFLISCWGMVTSETSAAHWYYPVLFTPRIQRRCRNFCGMCKQFSGKKTVSIQWRVRYVKKKRTVTVKGNIKVGTWVLKKWKCQSERSCGKEEWKINSSSLFSLLLLFSHFPLNAFSSKKEYYLIEEYVTDILAGSFLFVVKFLE